MKPKATIMFGILAAVVILFSATAPTVATESIDSLIRQLNDSDEDVSEAAEQALVKMGGAAVDAVVPLLADENRAVQAAAVRILGWIGTPATGALIPMLKDPDWRVRMGAARALGTIKDQTAMDALLDALHDEHQGVRGTAASALGDLGNANAIEPLIKMLKDEVKVVRAAAARGLGKLGDARAVDSLLDAIQEPGTVRRATIKALANIGAPALESMGKVLTDQSGDPGVRVAIAKAFERMRAEESVVALSAALQDKEHTVRKVAAEALVLIGPPAVSSVREVLLQNPNPDVRAIAAGILTEASGQANRPWAQEALAALIMALKDDGPNVRASSRKGIIRFKFQALEQLYVGLREHNPQFRIEIATTLADIGHPLSIRYLEELLTTETDPDVRQAAEAAIDKIKDADILAPN